MIYIRDAKFRLLPAEERGCTDRLTDKSAYSFTGGQYRDGIAIYNLLKNVRAKRCVYRWNGSLNGIRYCDGR